MPKNFVLMYVELVKIPEDLSNLRKVTLHKKYQVRNYGKGEWGVSYLINDDEGKPITLYKAEVEVYHRKLIDEIIDQDGN